ncbi:MAG: SLC13 family permease [Treponema sp.]|nr:SLC13 family permease [Spirochaetales bacterium]MDY4901617.1 SLC13 family permease [Treponema sp.]
MTAQILAVAIFLVMFFLIITERFPKQYTTLICGALTLLLVFTVGFGIVEGNWGKAANAIKETLNVHNIFTAGFWYTAAGESESKGIDWATIIFLSGMMVMVEGMARVGFFRWLCLRLAKAVNYKVVPVFFTFMVMSAVLSMFIDSITVILFLAAVTVELSVILKFTPVPMILAEIFCANLGGSSTMCGDPPNIIIGSKLGYSFTDFLTNTGLIAGISLVVIIAYFMITCKKEFASAGKDVDPSTLPVPESAIKDKAGFAVSCVIFSLAVVLLVTHANTHLSVASIGLGIAVITFIVSGKHFLELLKKIDYQTLLFFIGLFVVVGGLEQTGILELIANFIAKISGGNTYLLIAIIIWISAFASAFIDNIPFAATMVPVIKDLSLATGANMLPVMAYALSMGTDIGGCGTPIGASANVVGTSVAAKAGHPVSWGKYCKISAPATIIVLVISTLVIFIRYL